MSFYWTTYYSPEAVAKRRENKRIYEKNTAESLKTEYPELNAVVENMMKTNTHNNWDTIMYMIKCKERTQKYEKSAKPDGWRARSKFIGEKIRDSQKLCKSQEDYKNWKEEVLLPAIREWEEKVKEYRWTEQYKQEVPYKRMEMFMQKHAMPLPENPSDQFLGKMLPMFQKETLPTEEMVMKMKYAIANGKERFVMLFTPILLKRFPSGDVYSKLDTIWDKLVNKSMFDKVYEPKDMDVITMMVEMLC